MRLRAAIPLAACAVVLVTIATIVVFDSTFVENTWADVAHLRPQALAKLGALGGYVAEPDEFTVDVISTGSESNTENFAKQQRGWVRGLARHFVAVLENDAFPYCVDLGVTQKEREDICLQDYVEPDPDNPAFPAGWAVPKVSVEGGPGGIPRGWRKGHPGFDSLVNRPWGWWCAQRRSALPLHRFAKTAWREQRLIAEHRARRTSPSWLLVVDDDTFYHPVLIRDILEQRTTSEPLALTPMIMSPGSNSTGLGPLPYGGAGTMINRAGLTLLGTPINCSQPAVEACSTEPTQPKCKITLHACPQLADYSPSQSFHTGGVNFEDGMSIMDFMMALLDARVSCFHSDWWQGWVLGLATVPLELAGPCPPRQDLKDCLVPKEREKELMGYDEQLKCEEEFLVCHRFDARYY